MGHLAPTAKIGLLLQYFISKLIKKGTGKCLLHLTNNVSDVSDML